MTSSTTSDITICTCSRLRKLTRTVSRLYDQHLATTGLKTTQYSLLKHVAKGALGITDLALRLGLERTTLTRNLKPLLEAGWVKVDQGKDARQRIVSITPTGEQAIRSARQNWRIAQNKLEATLGPDDVQQLHQLMDTALTRLTPLLNEK